MLETLQVEIKKTVELSQCSLLQNFMSIQLLFYEKKHVVDPRDLSRTMVMHFFMSERDSA